MKALLLGSILILANLTLADAVSGAAPKRLVIIGDSLTEGYGVSRAQAFPTLLQERIQKEGKSWLVVNSGISGSTTASAPSRVAWALKQKPDIVMLTLGANDGLKALPTDQMEKNLSEAIETCQKAKTPVVLVGMKAPPNNGPKYTKEFENVFTRLAKKYKVPFIPFLLENVAGHPELVQADGIHPNEKGYVIIADMIYKGIAKDL